MSGSNSALASLTATYTDSEEEEEEETNHVSSHSPQGDSNSMDANSVSSLEDSRNRNSHGLVSYQDDLIDDDEVDDYHSDSQQDVSNDRIDVQEFNQSDHMGEDDVIIVNKEDNFKSIKIPGEPSGKCSNELQEKMTKLFAKKQRGELDMNSYIQSNKNFRNPSIYEKLIKHCKIDELGTNYPRDIYDPHVWGAASYYDELAKVQKADMDRREKEKKERTKVEFQSGTVKKQLILTSQSAMQVDSENRRKSKWDQRGSIPGTLMSLPTTSQPIIVHPNITTSATGTKSTVINAFGNLPKKTK